MEEDSGVVYNPIHSVEGSHVVYNNPMHKGKDSGVVYNPILKDEGYFLEAPKDAGNATQNKDTRAQQILQALWGKQWTMEGVKEIIIEKAKEIMLGTKIPDGVDRDDYIKFAREEINEKALELARQFIEDRIPGINAILKFIREYKNKFIQKYLGENRDKKIEHLEKNVGVLMSRDKKIEQLEKNVGVVMSRDKKIEQLEKNVGVLMSRVPMEGGRKRKYKKKKKTKKKTKKIKKKKTKKIKKTKRKN